jgi:hypothetical protein
MSIFLSPGLFVLEMVVLPKFPLPHFCPLAIIIIISLSPALSLSLSRARGSLCTCAFAWLPVRLCVCTQARFGPTKVRVCGCGDLSVGGHVPAAFRSACLSVPLFICATVLFLSCILGGLCMCGCVQNCRSTCVSMPRVSVGLFIYMCLSLRSSSSWSSHVGLLVPIGTFCRPC